MERKKLCFEQDKNHEEPQLIVILKMKTQDSEMDNRGKEIIRIIAIITTISRMFIIIN